ncbi:MAG: penicillin-binding protein 2 [Cycloclasticus sp.]|nr:penicillin-binding protein 2 [Cycloclasticus sp.]MBG96627.1 penicillin-binding protein 2 [Cycloclasticus sp.]HAI96260.1 penicillin-binding protein 2 [Methylococcaceae bacterium]
MKTRFDLKSSLQENKLFFSRASLLSLFVLVLFFILIVRLAYLQIKTHDEYADLAQNNRVKLSVIAPVRGLIFDTHGRVLAENNPSYSLELVPEQIQNINETIERLRTLLPISDAEIKLFEKRRKQQKHFANVPLRNRLNDTEVAVFSANRHLFPGVDIQARPLRHYPFPELTSHVVGYVGAINEKELKTINPVNYRGSRVIGKTGIEKTYETELHGFVGYQQTENTAQGRSIKTLSHIAPLSGRNLTLNIDIDLQKIAYDALGEFAGTVAAIDTRTGAVRALVSKPGFDGNLFAQGIDQASYSALQNSPKRPLFNRSLRGQYPPGSTLKPFFGLAALDYKTINPQQKIMCPGFYQLPKQRHKYRDWKKTGHGLTTLHDAIVESCDVYFYILAHELKIDRMHNFLNRFGFGQPTGIDILGEKAGLLPSREWKKRSRNQAWYPGETLIAGIGQGFNLTTPLQLAHATAILANKGVAHTPSVVGKINDTVKQPQLSPPVQLKNDRHWDLIIHAMHDVVHGARGSARIIKEGANYDIAGKTGTAQVFSIKQDEKYEKDKVADHLKDHALFIAFAPVEKPQLAIAVIVENGSHGGSVAAPIARAIFDQYLLIP